MNEFGVIFVHYHDGPTTTNNLAVLKHYNPDIPVFPVSWWGRSLPGGVNVKNLGRWSWRHYRPQWFSLRDWKVLPRRLKHGVKRSYWWRNADLPIYLWRTSQKSVLAKRWIILEWDVFCNVDLKTFYADVWDADLAAVRIHPDTDTDWQWFWPENKQRYPQAHRDHMTGISVLAGLLVSDRALLAISEALRKDPN